MTAHKIDTQHTLTLRALQPLLFSRIGSRVHKHQGGSCPSLPGAWREGPSQTAPRQGSSRSGSLSIATFTKSNTMAVLYVCLLALFSSLAAGLPSHHRGLLAAGLSSGSEVSQEVCTADAGAGRSCISTHRKPRF